MTFILSVEGGGTKTSALLTDDQGQLISRLVFGPGNASLLNENQLLKLFKGIKEGFGSDKKIRAAGFCMAGVINPSVKNKVLVAAQKTWKAEHLFVSHDLTSALYAAHGDGEGVVAISGTGSCVFGKRNGRESKSGGWGHLIGDHGSGYFIALSGLRTAIEVYDAEGETDSLGGELLRALCMNDPREFVAWIQSAEKNEVAALCKCVFRAAALKNKGAQGIMLSAATHIAVDVLNILKKLGFKGPVPLGLHGGVFDASPEFKSFVLKEIVKKGVKVLLVPKTESGEQGVLRWVFSQLHKRQVITTHTPNPDPEIDLSVISTEDRNPRTTELSKLTPEKAVELMLHEDALLHKALLEYKSEIASAVRLITRSFQKGGRLFYLGAGTSGRLGVLDASECPPTFSADPAMVQGIIAGGAMALHTGIEGAEDNVCAGAEALRNRGLNALDTVCGIAASGRTPFVWGGLKEARLAKAKTIILSCNPKMAGKEPFKTDVAIHLKTGPESLTGSTRLRAGTATKMVLNLFTTLSMVQIGKAESNYMIDLAPTNAKLRARATRLIMILSGCDESAARDTLQREGWNIRRALVQLKKSNVFKASKRRK